MTTKNLLQKVSEHLSPVHTTVNLTHTVDEALSHIRNHHSGEKIIYFYVVDEAHHLKGVVSTRNLLLSHPESKIADICENTVISVSAAHSLKEAMEILTAHRLLAVPVVDENNRLLGRIDIQLYLEDTLEMKRGSTDLFQVLGLSIEEGKNSSIWHGYRTRMPWIFCNMIGGVSCAIISRVFELVLLEVILLAMFIPLVLTLSESISMQSMTYSLQMLSRSKVSGKQILQRIFQESKMLTLLALTSGILVGGISLFWGQGIPPGIAICVGISISVVLSGIIGAIVPLILHARKLDPKVAAGPVVLMLADILTTATYLGLSTWWLL